MRRPRGLPPEVLQQQGIPALIVQPLAAVPGGIHAGCAVERVHAEAGIVGNGRKLCQLANGFCFQHGVFRKGDAGLFHIHGDPQVLGAHHLDAEVLQNLPHLPELPGVVGGQHESHAFALLSSSRSSRWLRSVSTRSVTTIRMSTM